MRSIRVLRDQLEGVARSVSALLTLVLAAALLVSLPQASSATTPPAGGQDSGTQPVAETTVTPEDGGGSNYVPLAQKNLVDTRNGTGAPKAKLQQGQTLDIVIGGQGGVPTSGVSAVALDLITTGSTNNTPLVVWPTGKPRPGITTHTAMAGENLSNIAFVELGAGGKVSIYNHAGQTDILVTVTGYFTTDNKTGAGYAPLDQVRVADSRSGRGMRQGQLPGGYAEAVTIPLTGVPTTATAAAVTFVLVAPGNGFINAGEPGASGRKVTASYAAGQNAVTKIVPVVNGAIEVINGGSPAIDVLVDVQGYLSESRLGGGFHADYAGTRLYDSRNKAANNTGTLAAKERRVVAVLGEKGLPASDVGAVMLQVTVTGQTERGIISVTPQGSPVASASTLNYEPGQTRTNSVLVRTGSPTTGSVEVYNDSAGTVEVIIDIVGWFDRYGTPKSDPGDGANYVALPQALLADTRYGTGVAKTKVVAGTPLQIPVAGRGGMPTEGVAAVSLGVTTVNSTANGSLQLWPSGTARPVANNHTTMPNEVLSNISFVAVGRDGAVSLALDRGETDVVVFVNGFFTDDPTREGFNPVPQKRVADTRHGTGTPKAQIPAHGAITITLDPARVPRTATAAAVNLTLLATSNGGVNVGTPGQPHAKTGAAYTSGQNSAMKVAPIADGKLEIINTGGSPIDVIVDVQGYFGDNGGGGFHLATNRIYDSKSTSAGALPGRGQRAVPVLGRGDLPSDDVGAVMLSVTVSGATAAGDLLAYPDGTTAPSVGGQLYYESGQTRTNTVLLSMLEPANGQVVLANKGANPVHVTIDAVGWFETYQPEIDLDTDTDGDSLPDDVEKRIGLPSGSTDTDGDGLTDALELTAGTDPSRADSDGNGVPDPTDDPDGDGITTAAELTDKTLAYRADTDGDGLDDGREKQLGTNPLAADSDGDGSPDGKTPFDTVATVPDTGISFAATGTAANIANIAVTKLPAQRLGDIPGQRGPPIDVKAPSGKVTGTLTIPFDTTGLPADADLAVLHYNETTGTFDRPAEQTVDRAAGIATVTTDQFSPFVVVDLGDFEAIWADDIITPRPARTTVHDFAFVFDSSTTYAGDPYSGEVTQEHKTLRDGATAVAESLAASDRGAVVDTDEVRPYVHFLTPLSGSRAETLAALGGIYDNGIYITSVPEEEDAPSCEYQGAPRALEVALDEFDQNGRPGAARTVGLFDAPATQVLLEPPPQDGYSECLNRLASRALTAGVTVHAFRAHDPNGEETEGRFPRWLAERTGGTSFYLDGTRPAAVPRPNAAPAVPDSDGDGLADATETAGWRDGAGRVYVTDPSKADTDGDGLSDGVEAGTLMTGGPFGKGTYYKSYSDPTRVDSDGDGLEDAQELDLESHPRLPDTDGDRLTDLDEVDAGFDPLTFDDDGDGRHDDQELAEGTDPLSYDYDREESIAAAFGGLAFGEAWDSFPARLVGITLHMASSPWYFVGSLCSGILVYGDLRDVLYSIGTAQWGNAVISAIGIIPLGGDAAKTVASAVKFGRKSPQAARSVTEAAARVLPENVQDRVVRTNAKAAHNNPDDADFKLRARLRPAPDANYRLPPPGVDVSKGWVKHEARFSKYKYSEGFDANGKEIPGVDIAQPKAMYDVLRELQRRAAAGEQVSDIRVNQVQVEDGKIVGRNRPDLQYTINGVRYYIEFDRPICTDRENSRRGAAHRSRILKNAADAMTAKVDLRLVGDCER